jgi:predicted kinase
MKMTMLVIMRGLSGSGKSTRAREIEEEIYGEILSTDDHFMVNGEYKFNPAMLGEYHAKTLEMAKELLSKNCSVILDNTNTAKWHYAAYVEFAKSKGIPVFQEILHDSGLIDESLAKRNLHGVPVEEIKRQRDSWEEDCDLPRYWSPEHCECVQCAPWLYSRIDSRY